VLARKVIIKDFNEDFLKVMDQNVVFLKKKGILFFLIDFKFLPKQILGK